MDIKGFDLNDDYFYWCTYINKDLIEEFDCLDALNRIIKLFETETIDLATIEPYYDIFEGLYDSIAEEAVDKCSVVEV